MWKKLLAILLLLGIPVYILFINTLPAIVSSTCDQQNNVAPGKEKVGFCSTISANVQRPYYFGLISLPVYPAGTNIHLINQTLPPLLLAGAIILWRKS